MLASEEAEEIVRLGLERLVQRGALSLRRGRVGAGTHPHASELLAYYARSLAVLEQQVSRRPEAQLGLMP